MENRKTRICLISNRFGWFCRGLLIILTAVLWYCFRQPMVDIPGMGTLSAQESAGKLEIPIYISMGLIVLTSVLGWKPAINLAVGGLVGFFASVGLRALERLERILLEVDDESTRATVNGAKVLPVAYVLVGLMMLIILLGLIYRVRDCDPNLSKSAAT